MCGVCWQEPDGGPHSAITTGNMGRDDHERVMDIG